MNGYVGFLGDSKTALYNTWPSTVITGMNAVDNANNLYWYENEPRNTWAAGSATAASLAATIDANILLHDDFPPDVGWAAGHKFLLNIGANDGTAPGEVAWKASMQYIIDALHTRWPQAKIYLAKPWERGPMAQWDTVAGWIDDLITANSGFCFLGHDERVWLEGGDDGATMTIDGIHYSEAGAAECAAQWLAILYP